MAARAGLLRSPCVSEPDAFRWHRLCAWLGAYWLRRRSILDVFDLRWYVDEIGHSVLLLHPAPDQHSVIRLHHASFDVLDLGTRRSGLARNFLSAGRLEEGNGVTRPHFGRKRAAENQFDPVRSGPWRSAFRE